MQDAKQKIILDIRKIIKDLTGQDITPNLEHPKDERHGDYSTNVAMAIFSSSKFNPSTSLRARVQSSKFRTPMDSAQEIAEKLEVRSKKLEVIEKVEVAPPGFINLWLSKEHLFSSIIRIIEEGDKFGFSDKDKGKKIMVEFAHPNTHKEMHIGHMRTLITGETLARIFETLGAKVFRANYQGDIGPHVAKAIFGIQKILKQKGLTIDTVEKKSNEEKAHFLGEAYVRGSQDYEEHKDEVDGINAVLYRTFSRHSGDEQQRRLQNLLETEGNGRDSGQVTFMKLNVTSQNDESIIALYLRTRKWSLNYYDEFYKRFYTKFDKLFFESEMVKRGKDIVLKHLGTVFREDQGAIVFKGEPYGLHTRVFVTQAGYPTYEGKEMANAFKEHEAFPFDKKIHVVASEQSEYFKVVFKALELIDAEKFKNRQYHIPMGMVHLLDRKMSSRTGDVLTVDLLIDQVKEKVNSLVEAGKIKKKTGEDITEEVAIGAIKYSVLKVDTKQDVAFDLEKSVSLEGNSGPYLQYTFARTQSVLRKSEIRRQKVRMTDDRGLKTDSRYYRRQKTEKFPFNLCYSGLFCYPSSVFRHPSSENISNFKFEPEEVALLRAIYRFPEVVEEAAEKFAPNIICNYLFDLAQKFNLFYQKLPIIRGCPPGHSRESGNQILSQAENDNVREFRLALTAAVGQVIKNGLYLLGIQAPERM